MAGRPVRLKNEVVAQNAPVVCGASCPSCLSVSLHTLPPPIALLLRTCCSRQPWGNEGETLQVVEGKAGGISSALTCPEANDLSNPGLQ